MSTTPSSDQVDVKIMTVNTLVISTTPIPNHIQVVHEVMNASTTITPPPDQVQSMKTSKKNQTNTILTTISQTTPSPVMGMSTTPTLIPGEQITSMQIDSMVLKNVKIAGNGNDQGVVITTFVYLLSTKVSVQKILDLQILETGTTDSTKVKVSDILKFEPSGTVFKSPVTVFFTATRPVTDDKLTNKTETTLIPVNKKNEKIEGNTIVQVPIISALSASFGGICCMFLLKQYVISPVMKTTQSTQQPPAIVK